MAASSHPAPPEQAAPPIVAAFLAEFIPNVKNEYELLENASEGQLKISLFDLQMETLIFGLHCLDLAVFAHHGAKYRSEFMDFAFAAACEVFCAVLPVYARDQFIESFQDHCCIRQCEYRERKLLPSDKGLNSVLSYEYAKRICFDAAVSDPEAIAIMVEEGNAILMMMNKIAQTL